MKDIALSPHHDDLTSNSSSGSGKVVIDETSTKKDIKADRQTPQKSAIPEAQIKVSPLTKTSEGGFEQNIPKLGLKRSFSDEKGQKLKSYTLGPEKVAVSFKYTEQPHKHPKITALRKQSLINKETIELEPGRTINIEYTYENKGNNTVIKKTEQLPDGSKRNFIITKLRRGGQNKRTVNIGDKNFSYYIADSNQNQQREEQITSKENSEDKKYVFDKDGSIKIYSNDQLINQITADGHHIGYNENSEIKYELNPYGDLWAVDSSNNAKKI